MPKIVIAENNIPVWNIIRDNDIKIAEEQHIHEIHPGEYIFITESFKNPNWNKNSIMYYNTICYCVTSLGIVGMIYADENVCYKQC